MVGQQQHIGGQRCARCHQGLLLGALNVTCQQGCRARGSGDAQHAALGVGLRALAGAGRDRGVGQRLRGVDHGKLHAIPVPALARHAGLDGWQSRWCSLWGDGASEQRLGLGGQHGGRTASVVAVAVAEHEHIQALAQRAQQRHQHALAGIAVEAVARASVVEQAVAGSAHQHGAALAHIGGQQFKLARRGPQRLPAQHGQQQRQTQRAHWPRQAQRQQRAAQHPRQPGPQRRLGQPQRCPGHTGQRLQKRYQRLHRPARQLPQGCPQHTQQRQRRDHQRDPRNCQQIGPQRHQRQLAKQQQPQRRQSQRLLPLLAQH